MKRLGVALFLCSICVLAAAEESRPVVLNSTATAPESAPVVKAAEAVLDAAIPNVPYTFTCNNGLYSTLTAMTCFKIPEVKAEQKLKLKVFGFKKDLEVRAMLQDHPAPLVVIFLGLASKSKDPLARLWESQLYESGCHVMTFDSIFRSSFNKSSNHGVAGNLEMEAISAANVINSFEQHSLLEGKVTKLGLLGASYGGILALNFARLAKANKITLKPDRVLVFSPPVSMHVSATLLDKMYDEDRAKFGILDLWKMKGHEPVGPEKAIPFTDSLMRAGIGYVFHDDLVDAINTSKDVYKYELPDLPSDGNGGDKHRYAFSRFIEQVVFPYWQDKKRVGSIEDLWSFGDLGKLLPQTGDNVHVVLTADDPLNDPILLKYVQRDAPAGRLTVLPRGGHLGYLGTEWAKQRVLAMFKD